VQQQHGVAGALVDVVHRPAFELDLDARIFARCAP